ncbi:MAG: type I methionyl aminopeptidase [Anaerolineales bacterium]
MNVNVKSPTELQTMREAGRIVARALEAMREAIKPGVSTWELDQIAARVLEQHQARPAFLGYPPGSKHPFPATITACINSELVHGIPSKARILQEGDIVSLDTGCHYRGFVGDAAFTAGVGRISDEAQKLIDVTEGALDVGIGAAKAGAGTRDISQSIQQYVESHGYSVIREYTGHGVGQKMHEAPTIFNWWPQKMTRRLRRQFQDVPLRQGMTLALEPMVSQGSPATQELDDHWTVVMADGSLSAHCEHTIAVVENEPLILTVL